MIPEGFPPVPRYVLFRDGRAGRTRLRESPQPVWYRRLVDRHEIGFGSNFYDRPDVDADQLRAKWLHDWVGCPTGFEVRPKTDVAWTNARDYVASVNRVRRRVLDGFWESVRRLRRRGLVTADEVRSLVPSLDEWVYDLRGPSRARLPPLPPSNVRPPAGLVPPLRPRWST